MNLPSDIYGREIAAILRQTGAFWQLWAGGVSFVSGPSKRLMSQKIRYIFEIIEKKNVTMLPCYYID